VEYAGYECPEADCFHLLLRGVVGLEEQAFDQVVVGLAFLFVIFVLGWFFFRVCWWAHVLNVLIPSFSQCLRRLGQLSTLKRL
jgi:hypothetical protein